jgi:hypothetical protein
MGGWGPASAPILGVKMVRLIALAMVLTLAGTVWAKPPVVTCDPGYTPICAANTPVPVPTATRTPVVPTKTPTSAPPTAVPTAPPPTAVPTLPPPTVGPTIIPPPIDVIPPTVLITDPKSGQTVAPNSTYAASADASDAVGVVSVQFKVNGGTTLGCTATASPWQCNITMPPTGTVATINAYAKDAAGNVSIPAEVNVKLGTVGPTPIPPTPTAVPVTTPTVGPTVAPTSGPSPTAAPTAPPSAGMPLPVQAEVDVTLPAAPAKWLRPMTAQDFQMALDNVQPGEGIELASGTTYTGNFIIKPKAVIPAGMVTRAWAFVTGAVAPPLKVWVRGSSYLLLPPQGTRVGPNDAAKLAKIVSPNYMPALAASGPASNWYFSGLEITNDWHTVANTATNVVALGFQDAQGYNGNGTTPEMLPDQVVFDRVWIHGTLDGNIRRGITINTRAFAIIDSSVNEIHEVGADNQAIGGWNNVGPTLIRNTWLEAACENFMMGGADTAIPNSSPSDLVFENNLVTKKRSWKTDDPSYAGIHWSIKNLFELKHMKRARIRFNVFDWWWPDGQVATMQFTPRNSSNTNPWTNVQDVEFSYNRVGKNNFGSLMNFLAHDSPPPSGGGPSQVITRMLIENNVFENVEGFAFQLLVGPIDVKIRHNTVMLKDGVGTALTLSGMPVSQRAEYVNNIVGAGNYFIFGDNTGVGDIAITKFAPDMTLAGNAFYGPWPTPGGATASSISGHPGNFFPASRNAIGFVNLAGGNYALSANSPYKGKGTDGKDLGADTTKVP